MGACQAYAIETEKCVKFIKRACVAHIDNRPRQAPVNRDMLIKAVPAKILAGGRNRFIQKNRGVGRHLQVDIQNGRIWTRTSPSSEDHQMDASSACVTALNDAGAPVGLALLIFTFMSTMKQER